MSDYFNTYIKQKNAKDAFTVKVDTLAAVVDKKRQGEDLLVGRDLSRSIVNNKSSSLYEDGSFSHSDVGNTLENELFVKQQGQANVDKNNLFVNTTDARNKEFLKNNLSGDLIIDKSDRSDLLVDHSHDSAQFFKDARKDNVILGERRIANLEGAFFDKSVFKKSKDGIKQGVEDLPIDAIKVGKAQGYRVGKEVYGLAATAATESGGGNNHLDESADLMSDTWKNQKKIFHGYQDASNIVQKPQQFRNFIGNRHERIMTRKLRKVERATKKFNKFEKKAQTTTSARDAKKFREKANKKLGVANKASRQANVRQSKVLKWRNKKQGIIGRLFDGGKLHYLMALGGAFLFLVLGLIAIMTLSSFCVVQQQSNNKGYGDLEGNCLAICKYLREVKGVENDVIIAAVCGNVKRESGYRTEAVEGNGEGHGLFQWSFDRKSTLFEFASHENVTWTDFNLQMRLFCYEFWGYGDDVLKSLGASTRATYWEMKDIADISSNVKSATLLFNRKFEGSGDADGSAAMNERVVEAIRVYEQLKKSEETETEGYTGVLNSDDYKNASEKGKRIVSACYTVSSPGQGWCAMWVSQVYQRAGLGYPGGNANDMYYKYCHSSDKSKLEVGMIVADPSHPGTGWAGQAYGHVGIYIGDGKVISNVGSITTQSLDSFISFYGKWHTVRWGWAG